MNSNRDIRAFLRLYLIADPDQTTGDFLTSVEQAVSGGVTAVQLRSKVLHDGPFHSLAERVKRMCDVHAVPIIINDRLDVALSIGADGVHVGVDDLPVPAIRRLVDSYTIVGYSPGSDEQTKEAGTMGADYVGLGPVFETGSKDDAGEALGLQKLSQRADVAQLPSVAIGGITSENAGDVVAAGVDGVAVISAILRSDEPGGSAATLFDVVNRSLEHRIGGR